MGQALGVEKIVLGQDRVGHLAELQRLERLSDCESPRNASTTSINVREAKCRLSIQSVRAATRGCAGIGSSCTAWHIRWTGRPFANPPPCVSDRVNFRPARAGRPLADMYPVSTGSARRSTFGPKRDPPSHPALRQDVLEAMDWLPHPQLDRNGDAVPESFRRTHRGKRPRPPDCQTARPPKSRSASP